MSISTSIPEQTYGVLRKEHEASELDMKASQVRRLGYTIIDSGYSAEKIQDISKAFDAERSRYVSEWGFERLKSVNEAFTLRAPMLFGGPLFFELLENKNIINLLNMLISGKYILNQQNGVINPARESYSQGVWHRDLPYQHFVSDTPLAINALFCVDDFTIANGSTFVLPASHKTPEFPGDRYLAENSIQIRAVAGQFIVLDCMVFHSGGLNQTDRDRRAVNHVYTIPYFKQQIKLANNINPTPLSPFLRELLGFSYVEPLSVSSYLNYRELRNK